MGLLFFIIFATCIISFLVVSVVLPLRWQGWWRLAALLPGALFIAVVFNIVIGTLLDKTSHNLWPLELLMWSSGGLVYLGILYAIRRITVKTD